MSEPSHDNPPQIEKISRRSFGQGILTGAGLAFLTGAGVVLGRNAQTEALAVSTPAQPPSPLEQLSPLPAPEQDTFLQGLVDSFPVSDYEPVLGERPIIDFDHSVLPLTNISGPDQVISGIPQDLDRVVSLMQISDSPSLANPDLSDIMWYKLAQSESYLQQKTLLELLTNLQGDLSERRVVLKSAADATSFAGTINEFFIMDGQPHLGTSTICINDSVLKGSRETNRSMLATVVYEYANRLNSLAPLVFLKNNGFFSKYPPKDVADVYTAINTMVAKAKDRGFPSSLNGNKLQLHFLTSLASLAGDSQGQLKGMERYEDWKPYKLHLAKLRGDIRAAEDLDKYLIQTAGY